MLWSNLLVLCLVSSHVACIRPGETLSDKDIERIAEQWDEDEEEEDENASAPGSSDDSDQEDSVEPSVLIRVNLPEGEDASTRQETDDLTRVWQVALLNANIPSEKYLVSASGVLYLIPKAHLGAAAKDFLVRQRECVSVHFNNQDYPCAAAGREEL